MTYEVNLEEYTATIAGMNVLTTLVKICENPGQTENHYCGASRSAHYGINALVDAGLIEKQKDPVAQGRSKLLPTAEGKSLYIGLWYAKTGGALLPRMQERGIPTPPAFWSLDSIYTLREADEPGYYFLVDTATEDADHDLTIYDVFIDPDGDMWFSTDGLKGRYCLDIEDSLDLDSPHAKECFKRIVEESKKKQAELSARTYDDLLSFTEE